MIREIELLNLDDYDRAFGSLGLKVGPRTGLNKRTKDEKEWWVIRRFLKEAIVAGVFNLPLIARQGIPPQEPDFILKCKTALAHLEITEATSKADQKEMAAIESGEEKAILLGELGGRFRRGASGKQPEMAWAADVIDAIDRKAGKVVFEGKDSDRHLVIYPNSNASSLIFDDDDEMDAARFLQESILKNKQRLIQITKGCLIHILAKEHVFLDIIGGFEVRKRSAKPEFPG